jgi:putative DNA primase/helicase
MVSILLILDNLSALTECSENAGDAWLPMKRWLLKLRRRGIAVLFVHHAGLKGHARGTSRREDSLELVMALRRPEDYSPEQECRFEVHIEKLRHQADQTPFEATIRNGRWSRRPVDDAARELFDRAIGLFATGTSVRDAASILGISKSEAGRLRKEAKDGGLLQNRRGTTQ